MINLAANRFVSHLPLISNFLRKIAGASTFLFVLFILINTSAFLLLSFSIGKYLFLFFISFFTFISSPFRNYFFSAKKEEITNLSFWKKFMTQDEITRFGIFLIVFLLLFFFCLGDDKEKNYSRVKLDNDDDDDDD